jgi:hypothetical protein
MRLRLATLSPRGGQGTAEASGMRRGALGQSQHQAAACRPPRKPRVAAFFVSRASACSDGSRRAQARAETNPSDLRDLWDPRDLRDPSDPSDPRDLCDPRYTP